MHSIIDRLFFNSSSRISILLLLLSTVQMSCVDEINRNSDYAESIVVNCILSNQTEQYLSVTNTNKVGDGSVFREADFKTAILYEEEQPVDTFERAGYNKWKVVYTPQVGKKYKLKVILPDNKEIIAYTTMPTPCQVRALQGTEYSKQPFRQYSFDRPIWVSCFSSNDFVLLSTKLTTLLLCDEIGTNHIYVDKFNAEGSLSEIIQGSPYESIIYYMRLHDAPTRKEPLDFEIQAGIGQHYAFSFITASYEYDRYMKTSIEKMNLYRDEDDPIQWFDEQTIYSNIENGVGIFAAYYETTFRFNKDYYSYEEN